MKQERNHRIVWETSFKNKIIPALILFLKTYMYRIPHSIHSIFIFMFIEKTLKIIININLHYFPPMCQWPMRSWRTLRIGCWKMGSIRGNALASYLNMIRKSGQRATTPTKKSSQRNSIFLTHKSYGYSEKCMRACVCLWYGKNGKGLRKQSWDALITFPVFFPFLFLYLSLKLETQPIQLRDRPFNRKRGGRHGFLLKKIIWCWILRKKYFGWDGYRQT